MIAKEEIHLKPKVSFLSNLEATVNLNGDEASIHKPVEKLSTPSFTSSNPSISLDLESFKLHTGDLLKENLIEEFKFNDEFHSKVNTNLSFLKSVNQMTLETKHNKKDFERNRKKMCRQVEITDFTLMKKGYLETAYYIYQITSKLEEDGKKILVERRYSDFEWLHTYLTTHPKYQGLLIPKMPEKHGIGASLYNYLSSDADFIKKRKNVFLFDLFSFNHYFNFL